jgi:hypothetical protein
MNLHDDSEVAKCALAISARTYIQNVIPKFEKLFGKELTPTKTPMSEGYHPEVDDTPLCAEEDSDKYRSIIGCCIWIIVLGRFDIAYASSAMSRFNMSPREGHLKAVKIILAYHINIYTDHKNLTFSDFKTNLVQCWLLIMEEYGPTIRYCEGKHNIVADF